MDMASDLPVPLRRPDWVSVTHILDAPPSSATPLGWWGRELLRRLLKGRAEPLTLTSLPWEYRRLARFTGPLARGVPAAAVQEAAAKLITAGVHEGLAAETKGPRGGRAWVWRGGELVSSATFRGSPRKGADTVRGQADIPRTGRRRHA